MHTRCKPYPALPSNIATFTAGRFTPRPGDLAEVTQGLEPQEPDGLPPVLPLRAIVPPKLVQPTALLIMDEDCRIEDFDLASLDIRACATLTASALRSPRDMSDAVLAFEAGALADAAARVGLTATALQAGHPDDLTRWAAGVGATQIVTPYVTRGPLHDWLAEAAPVLWDRGIALCEWRRDWDGMIWPHATAGFFKVRQKIPPILERLVPL